MPHILPRTAGGAGPARRGCGQGCRPQRRAFGIGLMVGAGDIGAQQPEPPVGQPAMLGGFQMIQRIPRRPGLKRQAGEGELRFRMVGARQDEAGEKLQPRRGIGAGGDNEGDQIRMRRQGPTFADNVHRFAFRPGAAPAAGIGQRGGGEGLGVVPGGFGEA